MRWSKTIQFGERVLDTPLISMADSILCPVQAYQIMCKKIKAKPDDPSSYCPVKIV